ncbi:DUF6892 domain-containing protein [Hymenobacter weizhouensis]|uniref:DUF6892 domain-containing protein n=1 Tax=Hymenobacter sp. YIM 151500-1 TaxID=2987689 RepID=UPI002226A587|nr:hypothetical protein [Hymenobacter sp. YIM 151500-1]UYZ62557.1 hypothetical protein OIS53_16345 [Hymenobacter sp. YIM 151500-1]
MSVQLHNPALLLIVADALADADEFELEDLTQHLAQRLNLEEFPRDDDQPGADMPEILQALDDFPLRKKLLASLTELDEDHCVDARMELEELAGYYSGGEDFWFQLTSLTGLEHCPGLRRIVLTLGSRQFPRPSAHLVSLQPLAGLPRLESLELYADDEVRFTDAPVLLTLPSLKRLVVNSTLVEGYAAIQAQLTAAGVEVA